MSEDSINVPISWIAREMRNHLIDGHKTNPEHLDRLKEAISDDEWVNFLVKSHYILHRINDFGEYEDGQFHFKKRKDDEEVDPS